MVLISSQDFQNVYERFYNDMRNYLWPFSVLEELSDVEANIYSAFIDVDKLKLDLSNLYKSIKDVMKDDKHLQKSYDEIMELLNEEDVSRYARLPQVNEVDPEKPKSIRTIPEETEEDTI